MAKAKTLKKNPFSKAQLLAFVLTFAAIGGYLLLHSFAAGPSSVANVFISPTGSDSGTNCKRFSPGTSTVPAANTVCLTASKAYSLAAAGDAVWALPGTYGAALSFGAGQNNVASKTVSNPTDCNSTSQCVYFMPQPGQEANVITSSIAFRQGIAPDHLYYQNFQKHACFDFQTTTYGDSSGFATDTTVDGFKALRADGDCQPFMAGPWHYARIINGTFEHACTAGSAGGFGIQSNESPSGTFGGEADNHIWAPDHITIDHDTFDQYNNNCTATDHQDCIHIYAWTFSTVSNSKFDNCWDSSILAEGLDETGYAENDTIENNWFGPTQLGVNNCCFRGDTTPGNETFDNWIVRFNSSTSFFMNKSGNVLHNVEFIGNVGLGSQTCQTTQNGSTNVIWAYNMMGGSACGATDTGNITNSQIKFTNINNGTLDLHIQGGSSAIGKVPLAQADGCSTVAGGKDSDGNSRTPGGATACDAGADEYVANSCPFGNTYADGCSGAAAGTTQYSNMLNGYAARPPWNVAGADYPVGIPSATALTPWRSASAANVNFNLSSGQITCTGPAGATVTLSGIDFSPASGVSPYIYGYSSSCNWVIKNSRFSCPGSFGNIFADNSTITNNEFDQANCGDLSTFVQGSNVTLKYNWFKHAIQHILETGGPGTIDMEFNLFDDSLAQGSSPICSSQACHENWQQLTGTAAISADTIKFNTNYQHTAGTGNGEGFQFYCNSGPCQVNNPILSNNTMICLAGTGMSNVINGGDPSHPGNIVNGTNAANYFDPTGCTPYYVNTITTANHWTSSGNIDMKNGKTINPADNSEAGGGGGSVTGDLNGDGHVTILDLSILLSHYGQAATAAQGDINTDGTVTILDLSILLSHYGT